jgi:hypothetical protein
MTLFQQIMAVEGDFQARMDGGTMQPLVANVGLKRGQRAFRHKKGEYYRFTVRALEDIKPLLVHTRVAQAETELGAGRFHAAAETLGVQEEHAVHGDGLLYGVMAAWLEKNKIPVPEAYEERALELSDALRERVLRTRPDTMPYPLEIVDIGAAEDGNTPVVPEEWLGRRFSDGFELRAAIDGLPSRQGAAEATFCCHYGLLVIDDFEWCDRSILGTDLQLGYGISVSLSGETHVLKTGIHTFGARSDFQAPEYRSWLEGFSEAFAFKRHRGPDGVDVVIACERAGVAEMEPRYERTDSAGVLSSRMQKCLRRGRGCVRLLEDSLRKLRLTPAYSLPEQKFQRTSCSRQLVWRLFISIFEDVEPYAPDPDGGYLSLPDLVCLSVLAHADPDLQFNTQVLEKIVDTAMLVQRNDGIGKNWDWRKGSRKEPVTGESPFEVACKLALDAMPMMERDWQMIREGCSLLTKRNLQFPALAQVPKEALLEASDPEVEAAALVASNDYHCMPHLLLFFQGSLPFVPFLKDAHTTQRLNRFIWDHASRLNTRNNHKPSEEPSEARMLATLRSLQRSLLKSASDPAWAPQSLRLGRSLGSAPSRAEVFAALKNRTAFLSLFGQSFILVSKRLKKKSVQVIIAGTPDEPCCVKLGEKYLEGEERCNGERDFVEWMQARGEWAVALPEPPSGFRWKVALSGRVALNVSCAGADEERHRNHLVFTVNGISVEAFDAGALLEPFDAPSLVALTREEERLVRHALYLDDDGAVNHWEVNQHLRVGARALAGVRHPVVDWLELGKSGKIPATVWQRVLTKLHNCFKNQVEIGPVDRSGDKQYAAVDYLHEGTLWRMFNLLAFLYPQCITLSGNLKFNVLRDTAAYGHLESCLEALAFPETAKPSESAAPAVPRITVQLWEHQRNTADRVLEGLVIQGRRGFGDASCVGAGKTLTAIEVMRRIFEVNAGAGQVSVDGFLVLVATNPLIDTWREEIAKHTEGFGFVSQNESGVLSGAIARNTIFVTTLARVRETPVQRRWQLVVVDECLAVQNREALQTQEAWRQVMCSQMGVVLLSATFFRARFDKLFYMLKMLRTGLPETREYLDTILSEVITCKLNDKEPWRWLSHVNRFPLKEEVRRAYEELLANHGEESKVLYGMLDQFLLNHFDYTGAFRWILDERLGAGDRALLYARSREEADRIAAAYPGEISRFPKVDGRHVVATTAEATYGVNTLVCCNTIIMRPPEPDKLPQMKGRLARPGQKAAELKLEYLLVERTIEEAGVERLERAQKFHRDHLMPLAEFYDLALGMGRPTA